MASVQYGVVVTEIKGKVGGSVFQSSAAGFSLKNKGKGMHGKAKGYAQRHDGTHVPQQGNFSQVTKAWGLLSDTERNTWNALVGSWTFINKFGNTYNGSAYQIFCAANLNRLSLGLSLLSNAPAINPAENPMLSYSDFSVSGDFTETMANTDAIGMYMFFQGSYFTTPTKSINKVRIAGSAVRSFSTTTPTSRKAAIVAGFGQMPPVGAVFYIKAWFCWADYPQAQFYQVFKINVVA